MLLIEADGKALFRNVGVSVPEGVVVLRSLDRRKLPSSGPWVVKAQVPVGGRGKAGGVAVCNTIDEVDAALARILGMTIKGHVVEACLVERAVRGSEAYLSIMVDAERGGVRLTFAREGGVEIEQVAASGSHVQSQSCDPTPLAAISGFGDLLALGAPELRARVLPVATKLSELFFARRLLLAEINPLFITQEGAIAGDAKVVLDGNVLESDVGLAAFVAERPDIYRDVQRKIVEGFDFIDLDPQGTVGLVTTGAGLSMMLIDELVARGSSVANFCDIRTGQMRGEPARLVRVLGWLAAYSSLKVVFVNVFAGITDLAEFARLLVQALALCPALTAPVVVRIVGRNEDAAIAYLAAERPDLAVYSDMEVAMEQVIRMAGR